MNNESRNMILAAGKEHTDKIYNLLRGSYQQLFEWYVLNDESIIDIAKHLDRNRKTIRRWLNNMFDFIESPAFQDYINGRINFSSVLSELVFVECWIRGHDLESVIEESNASETLMRNYHSFWLTIFGEPSRIE